MGKKRSAAVAAPKEVTPVGSHSPQATASSTDLDTMVREAVAAAVEAQLAPFREEMKHWFETESRAVSLSHRKLQDSMQLVESSRITDLEARLGEGMLRLEAKVDETVAAATRKRGKGGNKGDQDGHHYASSEDESEMVNLVIATHHFCPLVTLSALNRQPQPQP